MTGFTPIAPQFAFALQYSMAVQNGVLYRLGFGFVSSYNAATGAVINSSLTGTEGSSIAASGNTIFTSGSQVNTFNGSNGQHIATLLSPGDFYPTTFTGQGIAVNGNVLYLGNSSTNSVVSANATTGSIISMNLASTPSIYRIASYNGTIFTVSSTSGSANKIFAFDGSSGNALSGFTPVSSSDFYGAIAVIPEPSTWALMGFGLGATCLTLRRRVSGV